MISEQDARTKILEQTRVLPSRQVMLLDALGTFSARDLLAALALPSFDNSSMDGYALIAESAAARSRLKIVGEQPAGLDRHLTVGSGEAIRILTGAPMPQGADAVIMQEDVSVEGDEIVLEAEVRTGENVRRRGGDVAAGQKILSAGERIRPETLALLAAQGMDTIRVGGRVRAAIVSTGDELVQPGAQLQAGQIYNSNSIMLQASLTACGVEVVSVTHCADNAEETESAFRAGLSCDLLIVAGGVSVGSRDFVKPALTNVGVALDLWRVAVKPGKPFLFGRAGECAVFGLPGNPVSAFITFLLFVRPALFRSMGANDEASAFFSIPARLDERVENPSDRPHYLRGFLRDGEFSPMGRQESHALFGLSRSNALLALEPGAAIAAGAPVTALKWD